MKFTEILPSPNTYPGDGETQKTVQINVDKLPKGFPFYDCADDEDIRKSVKIDGEYTAAFQNNDSPDMLMPVYQSISGELSVVDGRHRTKFLIEVLGAKSFTVCVPCFGMNGIDHLKVVKRYAV